MFRHNATKIKVFFCLLAGILCLLMFGCALAAGTDTVSATIETDPAKLSKAGPVKVIITVTNSGDQALSTPISLFDPSAKQVDGFWGETEALGPGESKTWEGQYNVTDQDLANGSFNYYLKYSVLNENGQPTVKTPITLRAAVSKQQSDVALEVKRTVTPTIAHEGEQVSVRYDITNAGTLVLNNIELKENKDIYNSKKKITIPSLNPGNTATLNFPAITMGKKNLTSGATITYTTEKSKKKLVYTVEDMVIRYGNPSLSANLTSESRGVAAGGSMVLTLTLKNTGTLDFHSLKVSDESLGLIFSDQSIKAKETLTLTKEVAINEDTTFKFTVSAIDSTGTELSISADPLRITAMSPEDVLHLNVSVTADHTEVYEQPANVRFTITVENDSQMDALNVKLTHGTSPIYTFASIPAGSSKTISRDTLLSTAGKFRFTATGKDRLDNELAFDSNTIQVAFSLPTPVPATPTPPPVPTPEPTFQPATVPPLSDPSIAPNDKLIRNIAYPVMIVFGALTVVMLVLLLLSLINRGRRNKRSDSAVDSLAVVNHTDYNAKHVGSKDTLRFAGDVGTSQSSDDDKPHMKYIREAHNQADSVPEVDLPQQESPVAPEQSYQVTYADTATSVGDDSSFRPPVDAQEDTVSEEYSHSRRRRTEI